MGIERLMREGEMMTRDGSLDAQQSVLFGQVLWYLRSLARENQELRDRLWALDRAAHNHDPLEGEDG